MSIPPIHNLTTLGNVSGIVELTQLVNVNLMHSFFGILILISVFLITLFAFLQSTGHGLKSFTASFFIVFMISMLLRTLDLVPDLAVYASLAMTAFLVVILIAKG